MQVAISVVAACLWMFENPRRGLCVPDDLPHAYVLDVSKPYLGRFVSAGSDWTPLKHYSNFFRGYNKPHLDMADVWQFKNFLITEGDGI
jgi:homospermidine synthase